MGWIDERVDIAQIRPNSPAFLPAVRQRSKLARERRSHRFLAAVQSMETRLNTHKPSENEYNTTVSSRSKELTEGWRHCRGKEHVWRRRKWIEERGTLSGRFLQCSWAVVWKNSIVQLYRPKIWHISANPISFCK